MKTKINKKMRVFTRKGPRMSVEDTFKQAVLEKLDVIDKDTMFNDAETRELFGLNPKKTSVKANFKQFYRWAENESKTKGFSRLMEADVIRLVRESRDSLDTFEPCTL
ncbi:MAG TPA: hypothetical protein VK791_01790 [bacterium]|jgi:hypothetical protein|nr:hypothetical protein [bacterium]